MAESPRDLMASPKAPADMGYDDLGRFITALIIAGGGARIKKQALLPCKLG